MTSGPDGSFSVTGKYTCPTGGIVYFTASGGDAGGGPNPAISMMNGFGYCQYLNSNVFITINEVTTAVAATVLAPFAVDYTHIGTTNTAAGMNAIGGALNIAPILADSQRGIAQPKSTQNKGVFPYKVFNSFANSLAACINSNGTFATCNTLFNAAPDSSGNIPADTATAAINIAQHPAVNTSTIFGLGSTTPPFLTALSSAPSDWTAAIVWTFANSSSTNYTELNLDGALPWVSDAGNRTVAQLEGLGGFSFPVSLSVTPLAVATNTFGQVYVASQGAITKVGTSGPSTKYTITDTATPTDIASDASGNLWVSHANGTATAISNSGTEISGSPFTVTASASTSLSAVGSDGSGNIWFPSSTTAALYKLSPAGTNLSTTAGFSPSGLQISPTLAFDSSNNIWTGTTALSKTTSSGSYGTSGVTGGGLGTSTGAQVDGLGIVWSISTNGRLSAAKSSGQPVSPSTGYLVDYGFTNPTGGPLRIDGFGNIWKIFGTGTTTTVVEIIGLAAPVVLPAAKAAATNTFGTRP